MKQRLFFLLTAVFLQYGCGSDVPDYASSKALVLQAQQYFSSGDAVALEALFSEDFANGESADSRKKKFETLSQVLGKSMSVSVADSSIESKPGEVARVSYTLSATNEKINSLNTFFVVKEGGVHKIAMIDIQAMKE